MLEPPMDSGKASMGKAFYKYGHCSIFYDYTKAYNEINIRLNAFGFKLTEDEIEEAVRESLKICEQEKDRIIRKVLSQKPRIMKLH